MEVLSVTVDVPRPPPGSQSHPAGRQVAEEGRRPGSRTNSPRRRPYIAAGEPLAQRGLDHSGQRPARARHPQIDRVPRRRSRSSCRRATMTAEMICRPGWRPHLRPGRPAGGRCAEYPAVGEEQDPGAVRRPGRIGLHLQRIIGERNRPPADSLAARRSAGWSCCRRRRPPYLPSGESAGSISSPGSHVTLVDAPSPLMGDWLAAPSANRRRSRPRAARLHPRPRAKVGADGTAGCR